MTKLLAAWFVALCGAGCLADLVQIRAHPLALGFFWPVLFGVVGTAVFTAQILRPRWVLPLSLLISIGIFLGCLAVRGSPTLPVPDPILRRVLVDTLVAWTGMGLGYRIMLSFITSEGLDHVRMHTEMALAHGIQE